VSEAEKVERIARVAHEANRAWCLANGDDSHLPWDDAPEWQRSSARAGVRTALAAPGGISAGEMHDAWMRHKIADGWRYGPVKDVERKTHPSLVPFWQLSEFEQRKDELFLAAVRALS
jgi:hypothetical protein